MNMVCNCFCQVSDIKTTNETIRREITVEEGGQSVTVKLWNEHTEISINKRQRILMRNLVDRKPQEFAMEGGTQYRAIAKGRGFVYANDSQLYDK